MSSSTKAPDYTKWRMNHSMVRIKDPKRTIAFYEQLGLKVLDTKPQPEAKFDLYFLGYDYAASEYSGHARSDREGLLELTHNYGTENDPNYKPSTGNDDPLGFGHIGISVDNIQAACSRLDGLNVTWVEKLSDGLPHRAFFLDPDGYQVELVTHDHTATTAATTTDIQTYRFNHTAFRIKDPSISLPWYKSTLGMTLLRTIQRENLTLYFLGYPTDPANPTLTSPPGTNPYSHREGLIELIHTHGTESSPQTPYYHNGNNSPQGFGHLCVSVDDLQASCDHFESSGVKWKKRLTDGRMRNIAFILDPDEYWIEVIQNETLK